LLPVRVETVRRHVHGYLGAQQYRNAYFAERTREIQAARAAAGMAGGPLAMPADPAAIKTAESKGWAEAMAGKHFPVLRVHPSHGLNCLLLALDTIDRRRRVIRRPYLPPLDRDRLALGSLLDVSALAALKQMLASLFGHIVREY